MSDKYDSGEAAPARQGHPPLPAGQAKERIQLLLEPGHIARVDRLARSLDVTRSVALRLLVLEALEARG